jgi:hypothetical protein
MNFRFLSCALFFTSLSSQANYIVAVRSSCFSAPINKVDHVIQLRFLSNTVSGVIFINKNIDAGDVQEINLNGIINPDSTLKIKLPSDTDYFLSKTIRIAKNKNWKIFKDEKGSHLKIPTQVKNTKTKKWRNKSMIMDTCP